MARGAAAPVLIDPAFDDGDPVIALCRASAPYRLAAAVHDSPANGADLPWFRTYWARGGESLDLVMAMHRSDLFGEWAVTTASTISWFYRGAGGGFDYWSDGPEHPRRTLETPLWNIALLADNEAMAHRMDAVGAAAARMAPGTISREARLHADEDSRGWLLSDNDDQQRFAEDEVRISILWKALLFDTERDLARFRDREDDLMLPIALATIDDDLARRGLPPLDLDAGYANAARIQIHAAYPPSAVNQADPPSSV